MPVTLDGASGLGFISWRGDYHEASIDHGATNIATKTHTESGHGFSWQEASDLDTVDPAETVGELLAVARRVADGGMLGGYKGDWFTMHPHSDLYCDAYGEAGGRRYIGVSVVDGAAQIGRSEAKW